MQFIRSKLNPILRANARQGWESAKVYNPAAIFKDGEYILLYRAEGPDGISRLGLAKSRNGLKFSRSPRPVVAPSGRRESQGIEDPRLVKIKNKYLLSYTAYDGRSAKLSLAVSADFKKWQKQGQVLSDWNLFQAGGFMVGWDQARSRQHAEWSKAGAIFPKIIGGQYWMLFGDSNIWLAKSGDGLRWRAEVKPFLKPRPYFFDSAHLEAGPPPLETSKGWLVIYHGVDEKIIYRLGFLLLDKADPHKILHRSNKFILEPKQSYELWPGADLMSGAKKIKPRVIFCCGAILRGGLLRIYYGAGDGVICTAALKIDKLLNQF